MGNAMARALARGGCDVVAWNRSADKARACLEAFEREDRARGNAMGTMTLASSVEEIASGDVDVTFAMLSDPRAARAVARAYAEGASRASGTRKKTYVDCSTDEGDFG